MLVLDPCNRNQESRKGAQSCQVAEGGRAKFLGQIYSVKDFGTGGGAKFMVLYFEWFLAFVVKLRDVCGLEIMLRLF